jgi:hypothetical protein
MITLSGRLITLEEGTPTLEDIALGLSRMPRFAGQTTIEWNVAQHSLVTHRFGKWMAMDEADPLPMHSLFHDFHEALTGDIPTTTKTADMAALQRRLDARLYADLGIEPPAPSDRVILKRIDSRALLAEAYVVTPERTYQRICEEVGAEAGWNDVVAVQDILASVDWTNEPQWEIARLAKSYLIRFGKDGMT